jgi:hypothetical protein
MMSLKWTSCCKGRTSCPEIALDGDEVHIKDDYGTEVTIARDNPVLFGDGEEMPGNEITIYGDDPKKPVRMTLVQFYQLLEVMDDLKGSSE